MYKTASKLAQEHLHRLSEHDALRSHVTPLVFSDREKLENLKLAMRRMDAQAANGGMKSATKKERKAFGEKKHKLQAEINDLRYRVRPKISSRFPQLFVEAAKDRLSPQMFKLIFEDARSADEECTRLETEIDNASQTGLPSTNANAAETHGDSNGAANPMCGSGV